MQRDAGTAARSGSARRAGAIRPAKARGTASSIPASRRAAARVAEVRRARVLRRALRHRRDQFVVLPDPGDRHGRRSGPSARRRDSSSRSSCIRSSRTPTCSRRRPAADPLDGSGSKDVDEFRAAIEPLAAAGKLGALLAQFPASFKNDDGVARLSRMAAEGVPRVPARRRAAASQLERRRRRRPPQLLGEFDAALAQIDEPKFKTSIRQNAAAQRADVLLPAPARPKRRAVVEAREVGGSLQLLLHAPRSCSRSPKRRKRRRAR